jgi:hypothetical protein
VDATRRLLQNPGKTIDDFFKGGECFADEKAEEAKKFYGDRFFDPNTPWYEKPFDVLGAGLSTVGDKQNRHKTADILDKMLLVDQLAVQPAKWLSKKFFEKGAENGLEHSAVGFGANKPLGGKGPSIDPSDPNFQFGSHWGESSGRPFSPNETGLPISPRQLSTDGVRITERGVDKVEQHLSRFPADSQNQQQLQRLRDIASGNLEHTQPDLNNYTHELRESLRYNRLGYETGQPINDDAAYRLWNNAHTATLEEYGLSDGSGVLYHPSTY